MLTVLLLNNQIFTLMFGGLTTEITIEIKNYDLHFIVFLQLYTTRKVVSNTTI